MVCIKDFLGIMEMFHSVAAAQISKFLDLLVEVLVVRKDVLTAINRKQISDKANLILL